MDNKGKLYGTTSSGGSGGNGVVFALTPNVSKTAWTHDTLYNFCTQPGCSDGANPSGRLVLDGAGNVLGTTITGGTANGGGVVFSVSGPGVCGWGGKMCPAQP